MNFEHCMDFTFFGRISSFEIENSDGRRKERVLLSVVWDRYTHGKSQTDENLNADYYTFVCFEQEFIAYAQKGDFRPGRNVLIEGHIEQNRVYNEKTFTRTDLIADTIFFKDKPGYQK